MKRATRRVIAGCVLGVLCGLVVDALADEIRPQALQFSGKGEYVSARLNAPLEADCTLEAWVCMSVKPDLQQRIVALSGPGGSLQICTNGCFLMDNEGGPTQGVSGAAPQNDGLWHHVVIRRSEKTTYTLAIDARDIGKAPGTTPIYSSLYIGTAPGKPYFEGAVDEVRVYSRCLTNAEVENNYAGAKPVVTDGLVGWWKLDGDVADSVGKQNGQVTGAPKWAPGRATAAPAN